MIDTSENKENNKEDIKFDRELSEILQKFTTANEWVDLSNLLKSLNKTISAHEKKRIPQKKELAKRLSQCLTKEFQMVHKQTLEIYAMVFRRELDLQKGSFKSHDVVDGFSVVDAVEEAAAPVFGADMGLFISNLFNFYQFAEFKLKKFFLEIVQNEVLQFEKELLMSLSAFLLCILPGLDENNEELVSTLHAILHKTETIVGTAKLYGEIWKTMLRSPRSRLRAIKYLDLKIPKNIDEAAKLNISPNEIMHRKNRIYPSRYSLIITQGKMVVTEDAPILPEFGMTEIELVGIITGNTMNLQERYMNRDKDALDDTEEQQRKDITKAFMYFYYPNRPNLVINALLSGLHNRDNILVIRATYDFMISHIKIDGDFIKQEERVRLMEGALMTLINRDFAMQKKFFTWFTSHLDDSETQLLKTEPAIQSCIKAYKRILKRYQNSNQRKDGSQSQSNRSISNGQPDKDGINHPIMILTKVYGEDMEDVIKLILEDITKSLIRYIFTFYNDKNIGNDKMKKEEKTNQVVPLFEMLFNVQEYMWSALGTLLRDQIHEIKESENEFKIEAIDLIDCCLHEFSELQKEKDKAGKQSSGAQNAEHEYSIQTRLEMIIATLLKNFFKLTKNLTQLHFAIPALELLQKMLLDRAQRLPKLKQISSGGGYGKMQQQNGLVDGISQFNDFYEKMSIQLQKQHQMRSNSPDLDTFKKASEILCQLQQYADPESFQTTPGWLVQVINCAKKSKNQRTQLVAVNVLLKIIKPSQQTTESQAGQNIYKLQQLISPVDSPSRAILSPVKNTNRLSFTLHQNNPDDLRINTIRRSFTLHQNSPDDLRIDSSINTPLLYVQENIELELQGQEGGDQQIRDVEQRTDQCVEIIKKLWELLDEPGDHPQIVKLLKKFDKRKPKIFSDVITKDLIDDNIDTKRRAVDRFSIFWKLSTLEKPQRGSKQSNKYQILEIKEKEKKKQYIPFLPESERQMNGQKNEIQKGRRDYVALHKMLMILEEKDPTLRLSARSWLQDSKSDYSRIIDPLLKELILENLMFRSFSGQLFYEGGYNARYIKENFTKLRNIILTTQEEFIKYVIFTPYSENVENQFNEVIERVTGEKPIKNESNPQEIRQRSQENTLELQPIMSLGKYIQMIVYLTLQFIMGQFVESLSEELYQETQIVNASASEFMELVIHSISQYRFLCTEILHLIIRPLVATLRIAIDNQNAAQQVILLNLLKVILFENESLFFTQEFQNKVSQRQYALSATRLFEAPEFFAIFTDGIHSKGSFVRYHYIQFTQKLVPLMQKVIQPQKLAERMKSLIECFCNLMQKTDISAYETQIRAGQNLYKYRNEDEADDEAIEQQTSAQKIEINQENDIVQLIEGFLQILNKCLGFERQGQTEEEKEKESKFKSLGLEKQSNQRGVFANIFGIFFQSENENAQDELKAAIFAKIEDLLNACINCWNDFDVYRAREYFFTTLGIFSYNDEDNDKLQKNIEEYKDVLSQEKEANSKNLQIQTDQKGQEKSIQEQLIFAYLQSHFNQIQGCIIKLLMPYTKEYSQNVVLGFLNIWMKHMDPKSQPGYNEPKLTQYRNQVCEKVIQILLSLQVPADLVIAATNHFIEEKSLSVYRTKKPMRMWMEEVEKAQIQSRLCQFIYTYLMHTIQYITCKDSVKDKEDEFRQKKALYSEVLKFIENFKYSRHPNTICWMLEILNILNNKFSPPAGLLSKNTSLTKQMGKLLEYLLQAAALIIEGADQLSYPNEGEYKIQDLHLNPTVYEMLKRLEFTEQRKKAEIENTFTEQQIEERDRLIVAQNEAGYDNYAVKIDRNENLSFSKAYLLAYSQIPVFKDTIYQELEKDWAQSQNGEHSVVQKYLSNLRSSLHTRNQKNVYLNEVFRIFTVVTLRQVLTKINGRVSISNKIPGKVNSEEDDVQDRLDHRKQVESIVVKAVMNNFEQLINKNKEKQSEDGQQLYPFDAVYEELLTELLKGLTNQDTNVQRRYKQQIEKIFQSKGFFSMSVRSLRKWQVIMRQYLKRSGDPMISNNPELWVDLLHAFDSQGGFFVSDSSKMKNQSDIFRQLSFLIFSTTVDQINDQLDPLLKKMADSFKRDKKQQREFIHSLFLLSRILMLRLGTKKLAEALKKLWPHLLTELVSVFDEAQSEKTEGNNPDYTLIKEAIKIVELMSQLNIDEFQMNQWMFLFDGFGIKYEISSEEVDNDIRDWDQHREGNSASFNGKREVFQPYLVKYMCVNDGDKGQVKDRFRLYSASMDEYLEHEKNFKDCIPTEVNTPLFTDNKELKNMMKEEKSKETTKQFVHLYAKTLQQHLDLSNAKMMKLDTYEADILIEKDFLSKFN